VRSLSVLVVDDSLDCADTARRLVTLFGHRAEVAYDGQAAIEAARHSPPDVVLLDLSMPGMNGYRVAERLGQVLGRKPLMVALTGYGRPEDVEHSLKVGFDHHLLKPFDPLELERLLREHASRAG
jgi:CheY-like chemotaxis protein